jgi:hypothetical protein
LRSSDHHARTLHRSSYSRSISCRRCSALSQAAGHPQPESGRTSFGQIMPSRRQKSVSPSVCMG